MKKGSDGRLTIFPPEGTRAQLMWVRLPALNIDEGYQRSLLAKSSHELVRKIASRWNWALCQPLSIARRPDGSLWVVDGQHRFAGAQLRGDIESLPCVITDFDHPSDEARAFVSLNKDRRALGSVDVWRAQRAAGDETAMAVGALIEEAGLTVAPHSNYLAWKPRMVYCVPGIVIAYRRYGPDVPRASLRALSNAYPETVLRYAGQIFRGLALFYANLAKIPGFDDDRFIARLSMNTQEQWMRKAAERVARAGGSNIYALNHCFHADYDRWINGQ